MSRGIYKYCQATGTVLPIDEARARDYHMDQGGKAIHVFTSDEMAPTRHPVTGEYFTSKQRFREVTKAHGFEEVGTAYENGYDPSKNAKQKEDALARNITEQIKERLHVRGDYRNRPH